MVCCSSLWWQFIGKQIDLRGPIGFEVSWACLFFISFLLFFFREKRKFSDRILAIYGMIATWLPMFISSHWSLLNPDAVIHLSVIPQFGWMPWTFYTIVCSKQTFCTRIIEFHLWLWLRFGFTLNWPNRKITFHMNSPWFGHLAPTCRPPMNSLPGRRIFCLIFRLLKKNTHPFQLGIHLHTKVIKFFVCSPCIWSVGSECANSGKNLIVNIQVEKWTVLFFRRLHRVEFRTTSSH